jgi:nucleoside 2-deoxyribosyltransferase
MSAIISKNLKSIFVGGPIQHAISSYTFNKDLKAIITQIISIFSNEKWNVYSAHLAEEFGLKIDSFSPKFISLRDYTWMNNCDVFFAVLLSNKDKKLIRTDGTHVELGWASAMGKPIILLCDDNYKSQLSLLVQGLGEITSFKIISYEDFKRDSSIIIDCANEFCQISKKIYRQEGTSKF